MTGSEHPLNLHKPDYMGAITAGTQAAKCWGMLYYIYAQYNSVVITVYCCVVMCCRIAVYLCVLDYVVVYYIILLCWCLLLCVGWCCRVL